MSSSGNAPKRVPDNEIDHLIRDFGKKPPPAEKARLMKYLASQKEFFRDADHEPGKERDQGRDR